MLDFLELTKKTKKNPLNDLYAAYLFSFLHSCLLLATVGHPSAAELLLLMP